MSKEILLVERRVGIHSNVVQEVGREEPSTTERRNTEREVYSIFRNIFLKNLPEKKSVIKN